MIVKSPASLVINMGRSQKRLPCLILDYSKEGFRIHNNNVGVSTSESVLRFSPGFSAHGSAEMPVWGPIF
jgi:hypothetical protein